LFTRLRAGGSGRGREGKSYMVLKGRCFYSKRGKRGLVLPD